MSFEKTWYRIEKKIQTSSFHYFPDPEIPQSKLSFKFDLVLPEDRKLMLSIDFGKTTCIVDTHETCNIIYLDFYPPTTSKGSFGASPEADKNKCKTFSRMKHFIFF